jgi:predicted PurR-regulated permease PerM
MSEPKSKSGTQRGHQPPQPPGVSTDRVGEAAPSTNRGVDRGQVIGQGVGVLAQWSGRFILIAVGLAVGFWLLAQIWVGVLPVILALILATVLWPPVAWLTRRGLSSTLAATTTLLLSVLVIVGVLAAIAPSIVSQSREIGTQAMEGVDQVQSWLSGPPVNLDNTQIDSGIEQATAWLQERGSDIASGVLTGVSAAASGLVTFALVLVLTFFFLKDGPRFLPWVRRSVGRTAGRHLTEVFTRLWRTLSGFIRTQAIVSAFDAVLIGGGLLVTGVPLAAALAVLTFFGGFIPIIGAVTVGALAVLVALVSNGLTTALIVLGIVLAVQQIEGNVLQPWLQGQSMQLHAGIILLAVAAGGTLFGIIGAFLAVPVAASLVVTIRYVSEQIDLRTGDLPADELAVATPEGALAATRGEAEVEHQRSVARRRQQARVGARVRVSDQGAARRPGRLQRLWRRVRPGAST